MYIGETKTTNMGQSYHVLQSPEAYSSQAFATLMREKLGMEVDSLEALQGIYGQLTYSVGDTTSLVNWDRNDFPVSGLFQKTIPMEQLKHWQPEYDKPAPTGFEPYVQRDVNQIPEGSRAVVVHPDVQARMDQDPQYAKEIYQKIHRYFQQDVRINESILPGCSVGMSQFVSIGQDGNIDRTCTITKGMARKKDGLPVPKSSLPDAELLSEMQNTYGKRFMASQIPEQILPQDGEMNLPLQMAAYEFLLKKRISS